MRTCGCDFAGNDVIFVVLDGTAQDHRPVDAGIKKASLVDNQDANHVKDAMRVIEAFFREQAIDLVAIKQRAGRGQFAGGATSFKLEALVQLATDRPIRFVSPTLIARRVKQGLSEPPGSINAYQHAAYRVALIALTDHG